MRCHVRLALAHNLLADPTLDALISGESDFADLPATLRQLSLAPNGALCHRIRYPDSLEPALDATTATQADVAAAGDEEASITPETATHH